MAHRPRRSESEAEYVNWRAHADIDPTFSFKGDETADPVASPGKSATRARCENHDVLVVKSELFDTGIALHALLARLSDQMGKAEDLIHRHREDLRADGRAVAHLRKRIRDNRRQIQRYQKDIQLAMRGLAAIRRTLAHLRLGARSL